MGTFSQRIKNGSGCQPDVDMAKRYISPFVTRRAPYLPHLFPKYYLREDAATAPRTNADSRLL